MGNLAEDTAVHATGDGSYRATLSRDWALWGPNGGYLACIALRAVAAASPGTRPGTLTCQFANVAEFDDVELQVHRLKRSRRVELHRVVMSQSNNMILDAQVWAVHGDTDGPQRRWHPKPDVPGPDDLLAMEQIVAAEGGKPLPLWRNYEVRPAQPMSRKPDRPAGEPALRAWIRFRDQAAFPGDPWLDACRTVIATDVAGFPSVGEGFAATELTFIAPTLDLRVAFHESDSEQEWLLVEGQGMAISGGLCGADARVWSPGGPLLATGTQQMLVTKPRRG